jgi:hypothetical protein
MSTKFERQITHAAAPPTARGTNASTRQLLDSMKVCSCAGILPRRTPQ